MEDEHQLVGLRPQVRRPRLEIENLGPERQVEALRGGAEGGDEPRFAVHRHHREAGGGEQQRVAAAAAGHVERPRPGGQQVEVFEQPRGGLEDQTRAGQPGRRLRDALVGRGAGWYVSRGLHPGRIITARPSPSPSEG